MQRVMVVRQNTASSGPYAPWRGWLMALAQRADVEVWLADPLRPEGLEGLPDVHFVHAPLLPDVLPASDEADDLLTVLEHQFAAADDFKSGLRAWLDLLEVVQPDWIIADLSPLARVAARTCATAVLDLGHARFIPPRAQVLPAWRNVEKLQVSARELAVLDRLNTHLKASGQQALDCLSELWGNPRDALLYGWPALDPFERDQIPTWLGWPGRCQPPSGNRPGHAIRVLAVLDAKLSQLAAYLELLAQDQFNCLIHVRNASAPLDSFHTNPTTRWLNLATDPPSPADFDVVLCQDDTDTLLAAVQARTPVVMLATTPLSQTLSQSFVQSFSQVARIRIIDEQPTPQSLREALLTQARVDDQPGLDGHSGASTADLIHARISRR